MAVLVRRVMTVLLTPDAGIPEVGAIVGDENKDNVEEVNEASWSVTKR